MVIFDKAKSRGERKRNIRENLAVLQLLIVAARVWVYKDGAEEAQEDQGGARS